ncbi:MAG TPA: hypothetical protein VEY31_08700 [Roseococcus sp.]|jgi:hypothetical protein|nr:hypothetical protein [Roseococcus sp.]
MSGAPRRRFVLAGLAAALGLAATPALAKLGHGLEPAPLPDPLPEAKPEPVQYGPRGYGPPRRRRRRCRIIRERIVFRDRFGRLRERFVEREVCR